MGSKKEQIGRHCPYCGAIITFDEYFCRACHTKLTDQLNLDVPSHVKPDTYVIPDRKFWISVPLSCCFPGLGQFYNGDTLKGVGFGIAYLIVSFGNINGQYYEALLAWIWALALVEAQIAAFRINSYARQFRGTSYLLWIGIAGLGVIVLMHLYTGLPDVQYLRKIFPVAYFFQNIQVF